ncbi:2-phospho-L-lactate transferase [Novosphingobium colocasiae]|uniref:LPPG--FO 2-phospho-L-lactate transferase n=1 Tax=Novosphingobium colocasiae TaxID=1256513 RepID=A0A918PC39_9SPHN|nr:2-phospho-L-lactate transferase [Novosphingobium colocasiae]GGY98229.1 LPPG--FO 2-phospho-L-lactate transferase [Novosphingobium colocasiae]
MTGRIVILTGGVGGAKLVKGCCEAFPPDTVTAIVNTADDFVHLGLPVSPDIDTLVYTLSGKANPELGWGRAGESWNFMEALRSLGGPGWFQLGDGDLAMHVLRALALAAGAPLSAFTAGVCESWEIGATVLPMSDSPVRTMLDTDAGELEFQDYFVGRRAAPVVSAIRFAGAADARPGPGVIEAITAADTRAVLIAPSNPFLSVDPVLSVPGIREALCATKAPVVAVSPLVGGDAVKGPTAKLMRELGMTVDAVAVAGHYAGLIDAMLIDAGDPQADFAVTVARADTLMHTQADRVRVAQAAVALADSLR